MASLQELIYRCIERKIMTKIRGFELVSTYTNQDLLPKRETAHAAGYDLKGGRAHSDCTRRNRPRPNWGQGLYASG